ncbi:uncharacterized protein B0H18DRAFT_878264 [Fomitopsis serialis]|uniref:uncharacterized protein n=1 Tax=Fomitopsis serialis TaxID=139415 RepID=UPI002007BDFF|nr:uncharacterized protein B0H18DRAFT_878264 [Neoantrodia serialis]KAH9924053.1 hypothetical protein B0H18DRAFT_878264 [Neoantrodia serialis]
MAQPANNRSIFLGSTGNLFPQQVAADIYLQSAFAQAVPMWRVATVCLSWGMSVVTTQRSLDQGNTWGFIFVPWRPRIHVHDQGIRPVQVFIPHPIAGALAHQGLPPMGLYNINGQLIIGWHSPWHHQVEVTSLLPLPPHELHYHTHERRRGHEHLVAPAIMNGPGAKHHIFRRLHYSSQVQNFRRGIDIIQY